MLCVRHGGGRRCQQGGCFKVRRPCPPAPPPPRVSSLTLMYTRLDTDVDWTDPLPSESSNLFYSDRVEPC
eukprot:1033041-Prorocentrum_minimum.AAC.2